MADQQTFEKHSFSDYLYILFKWKKFLIITLTIVLIISSVVAFLLPNEYKATATVMIPPENQGGLGSLSGLTGLLGGKSSIASIGSKFFGSANTSEDLLVGIVNSRTALTNVIKKFHLMKYYEINDNNMDKAIKAFKGDISADPNDYGMIDFSIINKNPLVSAEIANYLVRMVDSLNIKFNIESAKNNRMFIEKRYMQNVIDLKKADDSLYKFQKRYGIVAVPQQLEATVKADAEIESELIKKEMEVYLLEQQYGANSPQLLGAQGEVKMLKQKVQEIKDSPNLSSTSNVLFSFKEMPNIAIQYLKTYREVQIQQDIMEIVMPMYEQAKVEEEKSIPTIMVVDKAIPPQLKYSPKRSAIIIGITLLILFMLMPFVFIMEKAVTSQQLKNPLQIKTLNFYKKIIRLYKIKF